MQLLPEFLVLAANLVGKADPGFMDLVAVLFLFLVELLEDLLLQFSDLRQQLSQPVVLHPPSSPALTPHPRPVLSVGLRSAEAMDARSASLQNLDSFEYELGRGGCPQPPVA